MSDLVVLRTFTYTSFALVAFASNSIFCRLALAGRHIGPGTFTWVRLLSGALMLAILLAVRDRTIQRPPARWTAALALFVYAAPFSFAYVSISAGTGALILFGAVQVTMIGWDLLRGKRLRAVELSGITLAIAGLGALTVPGVSAPNLVGAGLMVIAGVSWGVYSLKGRGTGDPLKATAANFIYSLLFAIPLAGISAGEGTASPQGYLFAIVSGAISSGLGYAVWYAALRGLTATQAGVVQLLVPVLAALAGVVLLGEEVTLRLIVSGAMILMGVGLAITEPTRR